MSYGHARGTTMSYSHERGGSMSSDHKKNYLSRKGDITWPTATAAMNSHEPGIQYILRQQETVCPTIRRRGGLVPRPREVVYPIRTGSLSQDQSEGGVVKLLSLSLPVHLSVSLRVFLSFHSSVFPSIYIYMHADNH